MKKINVLLLGDGPTSLTALRSLYEFCNVVGVLRAESASDPVRDYAAKHDIPVWSLGGLNELPAIIATRQPNAVVISSFNRIIPPDVLRLRLFINVHYSPLPEYRGRANVNWALINGENTAAISIHLVSGGLDDGNILFQERILITPSDTAQSLYERLNAIQERELGPAVDRAVRGDSGVAQDHSAATYGCSRIPEDGEIDWTMSSLAIDRLVRALSPPFPGAFTHLGHRRLVVARAQPNNDAPKYKGCVPGRVVARSTHEGWVDVLTGAGILRLFEIISDSGTISPASSIITSTRATLGLSRLNLLRLISDLETRVATLEAMLHINAR